MTLEEELLTYLRIIAHAAKEQLQQKSQQQQQRAPLPQHHQVNEKAEVDIIPSHY